ncbi:MAG: hypothetical protein FWG77_12180 [Treponema sp.]|nr:hypothetical protein [Treponema sp.]
MKFRLIFLPVLLVLLGVALPITAQANAGVSFQIRYFDRRVFYLDDEPILIHITLTNNSPGPYRFRLAEERAFSVDFDVRTNSNRPVDPADRLIQRRSQAMQVFFREITIETGESFSFVEDLRDYSELLNSGSYVIQARIYPELIQASTLFTPIESNRLILDLRHRPLLGPEGIPLELDVETNAVLVRERLPPDEVINYMLTARQRSQWERFFLYLDLQSMLSRDPHRRRQWNAESEEGRLRMLARYKQDLQNAVVDGDISMIPTDFTIERTTYDTRTAAVTVLNHYDMGNFTEIRRYTWHLERRNDVWLVVDYQVQNLGTTR